MNSGRMFIISIVSVLFFSFGCAALSRGPDLPGINRNRSATYRVDIVNEGHGSGVVVSNDGYIVTARHVAAAAKKDGMEILIDEGDGRPKAYPAKVIALDPVYDIAILKIDRYFSQPALLEDMASLNPGDEVYNVGYPYDFGEMVGRGCIQKLHWSYVDEDTGKLAVNDAILVDIPDGPGTSGSGVFLKRSGRLMGIMSMALWAGGEGQPPTITRVLVSVEHVKALLDANRVSYARAVRYPDGVDQTAAVGDPGQWSITIDTATVEVR